MSYLPPNQLTAGQFAGLLAFLGVEPVNRVWAVRSGTDGIGLDLFHVYAPTMTAAREAARDNLKMIDAAHAVYAERGLFTVHAETNADRVTSLRTSEFAQRPALDVSLFDPRMFAAPVEPNQPVEDWSEFFPERETGRFEVTPVPSADEMRAAFDAKTGRVSVTQVIDVVPEGTEVVGIVLDGPDPLDTLPHPWYCQCRECAEPDAEVR